MLVEFIAKLPTRYKLRGWTTKYILRESMKDILPKEILQRRKMGFPVPIRRWFKEGTFQALHDYLLGARTLARGLFKAEYVRHLLNSHISGHQDHSERLWSLLNLEMWHRIFIDGEEIGK
jgi:asparagine synthase (glutamine-hydrolysing)